MNRDTTFAPLSEILSAFLNGIQDAAGAAGAMNGLMVGGDLLYSTNGSDIIVSRIRGLCIGQNYGFSGVSSHTVTSAIVAADTWGYIYAELSAGSGFSPSAITLSIDTTGPDGALLFKQGDVTKRYVGCFRTYDQGGGTIKVLPFRASRRTYRYSWSKVLNNGLRVLNGGAATPYTNTPLVEAGGSSALLPPHARWVELYALVTNSGAGGAVAASSAGFLIDAADAGPPLYVATGDADNGSLSQGSDFFWMETNTATPQQIAYQVGSAVTTIDLYVTGFQEG